MKITPVLDVEERVRRIIEARSLDRSMSFDLFYAHLEGLDELAGGRVLEIGGVDRINLGDFFDGQGAHYENVALERNDVLNHTVIGYEQFSPEELFDLVISRGVFESLAIDRAVMEFKMDPDTGYARNLQRLFKLSRLVKEGGYVVIGTLMERCIFTTVSEYAKAGLAVEYHQTPFDSLKYADMRGRPPYSKDDGSELILLRKPKIEDPSTS